LLYGLIKLISLAGVRTFFRRISPQHVNNIPAKDPVIFVCNHPNTMMDPLVVGTTCNRKLFFFAKSTLFNNPFSKWLLPKLQLVPVYRKQDDSTQINKNEDTFEKGFQILKDKGAFLIFPEGVSTGDRTLSKIKTGAARIGFGAMVNNNWELDITMIPVGLSYSNAIKFKSNVIVRYGKPIKLKAFKQQYDLDEFKVVNQLTDQIETALSKLTTNVNDLASEEIVSALELIYKKELMTNLGLDLKNKFDDFSATKGLVNGVEWYFKNKPNKVEEFKEMFQNYQNDLSLLELKDEFLDPSNKSVTFFERIQIVTYIILGFPIYLYGIINNIIPYKLPRLMAKQFARSKSEIAPTKLITGIGIFVIYYILEILIFSALVSNTLLTTIYILSLIPSGNFVLSYIFRIRRYRQHLRFLTIFYQKRYLMYQIIEERQALIQFINEAKNEYIKIKGI
jgi:glycerol-3-phosphate O-acyltransferase/dihydroxyacetone phosphate acyltransferase